jgi:zinc transporter 1
LGHRHHIRSPKLRWRKRHISSSSPSDGDPSILEARPSSTDPHKHHHDLGIQAVLIHLLGDALNNIGVIIAAAMIWKTNSAERFYADPAMSMVIGIMLILTAWKLSELSSSINLEILTYTTAMKGGRILMLSEPDNIDIADVKHDLEKVVLPFELAKSSC